MAGHTVEPRKAPSQTRSRATVERILDAAARVFADEGYAATTDAIAARAAVSVGSLYQYFPNKDALLLELMRRHMAGVGQGLGGVLRPGRCADEWLPEAVAWMVGLHSDGDLQRVLFGQAPRVPEIVAAFERLNEEAVEAVARLLADEGGVADPIGTATALVGLVEGMVHSLVGQVETEALEREVTRAAAAYLASRSVESAATAEVKV